MVEISHAMTETERQKKVTFDLWDPAVQVSPPSWAHSKNREEPLTLRGGEVTPPITFPWPLLCSVPEHGYRTWVLLFSCIYARFYRKHMSWRRPKTENWDCDWSNSWGALKEQIGCLSLSGRWGWGDGEWLRKTSKRDNVGKWHVSLTRDMFRFAIFFGFIVRLQVSRASFEFQITKVLSQCSIAQ